MRTLFACASVAALAFALSTPAMAQDNADTAEEGDGLGMIVVTAQKRSENIQDVPMPFPLSGPNSSKAGGSTRSTSSAPLPRT